LDKIPKINEEKPIMALRPLLPLNHRDRRILFNASFGHFMSHFNMLVFPALVLPLTLRLNMEMAEVLGLSFWMYLFFGLTALPWGIVADRFGARSLLCLFYLGSGISGISAALWLDSPGIFALLLAALGLFSGIYHPAGLGLISKEMNRVGLGMGFNGMAGNVGLALAPILTGTLNWLWGPRAAYLILGALNICGAVFMLLFPITESRPSQSGESDKANGMLGAFVILLIAMMIGGIVYRGASVILPTYFELKTPLVFEWLVSKIGGGFSENLVATAATSFIFIIGMLGQYSGGRCAERLDPRLSYLVYFGITGPAAICMALSRNFLLVGLAVVFFFFLLGMQPIENTLIARFTPKRFHHSAYGTKFILTFGVGALAVKLVAATEQAFQIESVFFFLALFVGVALGLIILVIMKTKEKRAEDYPDAGDLRIPDPNV
jgi:MFS family permease